MQPKPMWCFPVKGNSKLNHVTICECYFKMEGAGRCYDVPLRHSVVVTIEVVNPPVLLICSVCLREGFDFHQILPRKTLQYFPLFTKQINKYIYINLQTERKLIV
jgi:hypothetical protein